MHVQNVLLRFILKLGCRMLVNFGATTRWTIYCFNRVGVVQAISHMTKNYQYLIENSKCQYGSGFTFKCDDGEVFTGGLQTILDNMNTKFGDIFSIRYSKQRSAGDGDIVTTKPHNLENVNLNLIFDTVYTNIKEQEIINQKEEISYAFYARKQTEETVGEDPETNTRTDPESGEEDQASEDVGYHQLEEQLISVEDLIGEFSSEQEGDQTRSVVDLASLDFSNVLTHLPGTDLKWKSMRPPKMGRKRVYELGLEYGIDLDQTLKVEDMTEQFKNEMIKIGGSIIGSKES